MDSPVKKKIVQIFYRTKQQKHAHLKLERVLVSHQSRLQKPGQGYKSFHSRLEYLSRLRWLLSAVGKKDRAGVIQLQLLQSDSSSRNFLFPFIAVCEEKSVVDVCLQLLTKQRTLYYVCHG